MLRSYIMCDGALTNAPSHIMLLASFVDPPCVICYIQVTLMTHFIPYIINSTSTSIHNITNTMLFIFYVNPSLNVIYTVVHNVDRVSVIIYNIHIQNVSHFYTVKTLHLMSYVYYVYMTYIP